MVKQTPQTWLTVLLSTMAFSELASVGFSWVTTHGWRCTTRQDLRGRCPWMWTL